MSQEQHLAKAFAAGQSFNEQSQMFGSAKIGGAEQGEGGMDAEACEESQVTQGTAGGDDDYYYLTLSIHYETHFGEYLCVTGDIPELGSWNNFKCRLQWNEGHMWTTPKPIKTKQPLVQYKYLVLHQQDEPKQWEHGQNRLADLDLLAAEKAEEGST